MTLFTLLLVSGLVMIALLVHKQMELSYGRGFVVKGFLHSADVRVHSWYSCVRAWFLLVNTENVFRALNVSFVFCARCVMYASRYIHKKAHTTAENFSRREEAITSSVSKSEYLHKIKETKDKLNHTEEIKEG